MDSPSNKETDTKKKEKRYTLRLGPQGDSFFSQLAEEEGMTKSELVRRALEFYKVKQRAKKENKRILLVDEETDEAEWVMI